jgi:hypothetical protein
MLTDRRSFLQGIAAVLSAATLPAGAIQPSQAMMVGAAAADCPVPIGGIVFTLDQTFEGFVPLDGRMLLLSEFPRLRDVVGTKYGDDAILLGDLRAALPMPSGSQALVYQMRVA